LNRPVIEKINYKKPDFTAQITNKGKKERKRKKERKKKKEKERKKERKERNREREREREKLPTNLPISYKRRHKTTIKLHLTYSMTQYTKFYHAVLRFQNIIRLRGTQVNVISFTPRTKLTLRRLMSYIYGAPILDVSRSHTTTQHSR